MSKFVSEKELEERRKQHKDVEYDTDQRPLWEKLQANKEKEEEAQRVKDASFNANAISSGELSLNAEEREYLVSIVAAERRHERLEREEERKELERFNQERLKLTANEPLTATILTKPARTHDSPTDVSAESKKRESSVIVDQSLLDLIEVAPTKKQKEEQPPTLVDYPDSGSDEN